MFVLDSEVESDIQVLKLKNYQVAVITSWLLDYKGQLVMRIDDDLLIVGEDPNKNGWAGAFNMTGPCRLGNEKLRVRLVKSGDTFKFK